MNTGKPAIPFQADQHLLFQAFDAFDTAIAICDGGGVIQYANRQFTNRIAGGKVCEGAGLGSCFITKQSLALADVLALSINTTGKHVLPALQINTGARVSLELSLLKTNGDYDGFMVCVRNRDLAPYQEVKDIIIFQTDTAGNILTWNEGGKLITGYRAEDVEDRSHNILYPLQEQEKTAPDLMRSAAVCHGSAEATGMRLKKDGTRFWAKETLTALHENGSHTGFLVIMQDLTEQRIGQELQDRQLQNYQALVKHFPNGSVVVFDNDLKYSVAGGNAFSGQQEKDGPRTLGQLFSKTVFETIEAHAAAVFKDESSSFEFESDGRNYLVNTVPVKDGRGKIQSGILISQDITDLKDAGKALGQQNNLLSAVFQGTNDSIYVKDLEGRYLMMNEFGSRIFGREPEDIIGKDDYALFSEEEAKAIRDFDAKVVADQKVINYERNSVFNGQHYTFHTTKGPLYNASGQVSGLVGISRDITERKQAEEALLRKEAELKDAQHLAKLCSYDIDIATGVIKWSGNATKLFGLHEGEMPVAQHLNAINQEQQDVAEKIWLNALEQKIPYTIEYQIRKQDGEPAYVISIGKPLLNEQGDIVKVIGTLQDVTERKLAELRIQERTIQLEAAVKELEGFSYSVSHDLRAPLRAIVGFAQIMQRDHSIGLTSEGRRMLDVIMNNSKRMGQLIDDLLEFSRMGRKEQKIYKFDMTQLAEEVIKVDFPDVRQHIEFDLQKLPHVTADRSMISVLLSNLISNAVKFSVAGCKNKITIGFEDVNGENVYYIRDQGVGFDLKYKNKLFGVFQRLHSVKEFEGTGVGLALAQRIVHRHGGRIWAEAEVNKGATFYFTLVQNN